MTDKITREQFDQYIAEYPGTLEQSISYTANQILTWYKDPNVQVKVYGKSRPKIIAEAVEELTKSGDERWRFSIEEESRKQSDDYVYVTYDEMIAFLDSYPGDLVGNTSGICEPPMRSANDFRFGNWPNSVVASYFDDGYEKTDCRITREIYEGVKSGKITREKIA